METNKEAGLLEQLVPITIFPNPILNLKVKEVTDFSENNLPELKMTIARMVAAMKELDGIGLAANQINEDISLIVVDTTIYSDYRPESSIDPPVNIFPYYYINPSYTQVREEGTVLCSERCLSFPDIKVMVKRYRCIDIEYKDLSGELHKHRVSGFAATVLQHEIDHLAGITLYDKAGNLKKKMIQKRLDKKKKLIRNRKVKIPLPALDVALVPVRFKNPNLLA